VAYLIVIKVTAVEVLKRYFDIWYKCSEFPTSFN